MARGFADAIGARLEPEDTPGGGLTMVLTLPRALEHAAELAEADDETIPEPERQA